MICKKCGKELNENFQVCPYCGSPIQQDVNIQQNASYNYGNQQMPQSGSYSYGNQANYAQQPKKKNTIGILSLILGIAGLLLSCVIVGIVPAIAAVVLGIIGIVKNNGKGQSIAGIVCGIIGILIFLFALIISGTTDTGSVADAQKQTEAAEKQQKESSDSKYSESEKKDTKKSEEQMQKEFIDSCQEFDYKKIARNPDDYIGQNFKVTVQIYSKSECGLFTESYMKAYTDDGSGTYFDKMIYVFDEQNDSSASHVNVLENDIITVYGTFDGMEDTTNMLNGEKSKDVALHMKYAKLISEGE